MQRWLRIVLLLAIALAVPALGRVSAVPAVSLAVAAQPATVPAGGQLLYTITVTNASQQHFQGLIISATLPAGFVYLPGSTAITLNGTRFSTQDPAVIGRNLTWHRLSLPAARTGGFGMHTFVQDRCQHDYIDYQLDRVLEVVGTGAYVKQLFYGITSQTAGPHSCWVHFVNAAYDRGLIPVVRLQGPFGGPHWIKPQPDPSGGYATIAEAYKRVVAGLPRRDSRLLYVEVWNEPNLALEWSGAPSPVEYGRFLVDVAAAIRSLGDPRILILNGALSPGGDVDNLQFIDALATVPGALQAFDVWASHPYPGNHPPEYNIRDRTAAYNRLTIDSYLLELERLAAHGRTGLRVLLTETGYALGAQDFAFEGYPPIGEENRADYISRALRDYWSRWPEVLGVCPFELVDPHHVWHVWDWLYPDGRHHAQFDAVAALPTPQPAPSVLTLSFRVAIASSSGTYTCDVSAMAGGVTLANASGLAPVVVQPGATPLPSTPPPADDPHALQLLSNRSFEADSGWTFMGRWPAGYATAEARTGARSLRLGLEPGTANIYAYSSAEQPASRPAYPGRSRISFWYRPLSSDTVGDHLKVLVRDAGQVFHTLGYLDLNAPGWTDATFDTTGYQAHAVRLTVVNDGFGGQTAVYIDDVSWTLTRFEHRYVLPLICRSAGPAAAATPAGTPVPAPVTPLAPVELQALARPGDASGYRAVAIDPVGGLVYAVGDDGVWALDPSGRQRARRVLDGPGYRALLVDGSTRRLLASDWASGALVALDLGSGRAVAWAERLLRPSGLVAYGDRVFVAETGADQVVTLDRHTAEVLRRELVGPAPYALAVDPTQARVWVANAGGRSVTVLDARSGMPLGAVQLDGLGHPQGVAVDSLRGRAYATYLLAPRYHALAVIDARTLRIERVLRGDRERPLLGAYGVAVEPASGRVLLSDVAGLLALCPDTFAAETLVPGHGFVPSFGLVADPARRRMLAADSRRPAVLMLHLR
jgi:uncharacterized repeat protein (TIGR01451 family)